MKKKLIIIIIVCFSFCLNISTVKAENEGNNDNNISEILDGLESGNNYGGRSSTETDNNNVNENTKNSENNIINEVENQNCTGLLGTFAEDLEGFLKIIRILAPLLVIAFSIYEYIGAIVNKDDDALKKSNKRLLYRLLIVAILFLLPTLLNLLLMLIDAKYTTCIS